MNKKIASMLVVFLLIAVLSIPALGSPAPDEPWTLHTDGVPIYCGNAAQQFHAQNPEIWPTVVSVAGEQLSSDALAGTGAQMHWTQGGTETGRTIILLGDLTGSGRFDITQMVALAELMTGSNPGTELQMAAADLNGNGAPDIADLVILASYVLNAAQPAPAQSYPQPEPGPSPDPQSTSLVAYYSASGNTKRIAELIADALDADLFAIEPVQPYTDADLDYNDPDSRVSREHADVFLRDVPLVQTVPPDFSQYDTVLIGYPIWWGDAAWPVDGFVQGNDFSGKNVYCFCTSGGSGLGQTANSLEAMAGTGSWHGGMRFSPNADAAAISAWLETILP